jgi:4-hydroxy-2-oxoheptanedioate aldolase
MVPHCISAADAQRWVRASRFPPVGRRGFDGAGADADYSLAPGLEHIRHANQECFVVVQIEDREAVECIEEIAAVPGIDLLFVGPADLSISYGVPMQFDHPALRSARQRVAAAAAASGKAWGTITGTAEAAQRAIDEGAQFITCGNDHDLLVKGFQAASERFAGVTAKAAVVDAVAG